MKLQEFMVANVVEILPDRIIGAVASAPPAITVELGLNVQGSLAMLTV